MLDFDPDRFLRIQTGAVRAGRAAHDLTAALMQDGHDRVIFSGSGGAAILMQPAAGLLLRRGGPGAAIHAPDAVAFDDARIGPGAIAVVPSLSGTTAESLRFCDWARGRGATVIALTGHAGTPVAEAADHAVVNFAEDDTSCESFQIQSLLIAAAALGAVGKAPAGLTAGALEALPAALLAAKRQIEPAAPDWAAHLAAPGGHILTGAGNTWPAAHYYAMCILEEMQWLRTRPVAAAQFFHGTLELLEPGQSLIVFQGEDAARAQTERVLAFARGISERVRLLDSRDAALAGIDPALRPCLAPMVLATWAERISAHLARLRGHPLSTRRYYRRMAY